MGWGEMVCTVSPLLSRCSSRRRSAVSRQDEWIHPRILEQNSTVCSGADRHPLHFNPRTRFLVSVVLWVARTSRCLQGGAGYAASYL